MGLTAKEAADALAIGGLRNTAESVSRLTYSAKFGRGLGVQLHTLLLDDMKAHRDKPEDSWSTRTVVSIGIKDDAVPLSRPPAEAIDAVRNLIMGYVGTNSYIASNPNTKIHAPLLESWHAAARDPDRWAIRHS